MTDNEPPPEEATGGEEPPTEATGPQGFQAADIAAVEAASLSSPPVPPSEPSEADGIPPLMTGNEQQLEGTPPVEGPPTEAAAAPAVEVTYYGAAEPGLLASQPAPLSEPIEAAAVPPLMTSDVPQPVAAPPGDGPPPNEGGLAPNGGGPPPEAPDRTPERGTFGATILGTFPLIISLAAIVTIAVFILPIDTEPINVELTNAEPINADRTWFHWYRYVALATGLVVSSLTGLAIAKVYGPKYAAPASSNPRVYGELRARWEDLNTRLAAYCPPDPPADTDPRTVPAQFAAWLAARAAAENPNSPTDPNSPTVCAQTAACLTARAHSCFVGTEIGVLPREDGIPSQATGARWVLGTGFIDLWGHLHSAEEALFLVQPEAEVIGSGASDEMRLKDSGIDNSTDYLDKLRWGVATLNGGRYLSGSPPLPTITEVDQTSEAKHRARAVLREVRRVIDEYRDARREALVRARNQLLWTGTVTGLAAYVLVAAAVLTVPDGRRGREAIIAAAAFFLVGAVVGLFDQLRRGSGTVTGTEEDYGLTQARLFYIPLLSGLAAVGGVLVTAMLYGTLTDTIPPNEVAAAAATPSPTVVVAAAATPGLTAAEAEVPTPSEPDGTRLTGKVPSLESVFNLQEDRFGLVIAAVFGLTPGLLVDRLQNQAARYTSELQSTSAQSIRRQQ